MADSAIPTLFSQFCFFKSLSYSLYEYDWYNFVEQWQAMVAVNAPIPEFTHNLVPFFSNARRLIPVFHRYLSFARQDAEFLNTLTNVLMSTPLMIKVQEILRSPSLFQNYVSALKLDNPSASHTQVMQSIQAFLSALPAPTRLRIQRAFAEAEASDSMGLSTLTLETVFQLLRSDTQLYIDVLTTLQLNQTRNMPWDTVVSKIRGIVTAKKPYIWSDMDQFLKQLHWGHYQVDYGYQDDASYGEGHYGDYGEYENDDIVERVEGVDYYPDEQDEREFGRFGSDMQGTSTSTGGVKAAQKFEGGSQDGRSLGDQFSKMTVADKRPVVATF
ncbi:hypothetical protein BC939DRAFT_474314 [Gamsiella multidivaricata]|uniref:uncharacterized protein n=1 Tax=Gamsiella multidivaricata TaxID=101098 RepID=UPI0022206AEE|nr:uncharacterized protein BC939DRAFT_474314 [Gamsiella multidivaricata]KAG0350355.1 hypothetical protein BGZ54_003876 [Gamsiella multidivaricata]KAI7829400.1 hypothetical protein BC939DRAFT_474314 [Gamsiella multidivaricata]